MSSRYQAQAQSGGIRKEEEEDLERVGGKEGRTGRGTAASEAAGTIDSEISIMHRPHTRARRCILPSSKLHYFMTAESISDCEANKKPSEPSFPSNIRMEMMVFCHEMMLKSVWGAEYFVLEEGAAWFE